MLGTVLCCYFDQSHKPMSLVRHMYKKQASCLCVPVQVLVD